MDGEAIVLAGGLGTRLRAVLPDLPKPLAPVQGKPFLSYLLQYLAGQGIQRVILSLGYGAAPILDWLTRYTWDMEVVPVVEQQPLGTGGALAYAWEMATADRVFFLNGDTFFPIRMRDFATFHKVAGTPVSVALAHVAPADRYGLVEVEGGRVRAFREKAPAPAGWIYGGIALVEADWWEAQPWEKVFSWEAYLTQAVPVLPVGAYQAHGAPFIDIGVPQDYERAQILVPQYAGF